MWWEIIPSFAIITTIATIPMLATRAVNRLAHDGNPYKRNYTNTVSAHLIELVYNTLLTKYHIKDPYAMFWHKRDTQHGKPSLWTEYVKVRNMYDQKSSIHIYFSA